MARCEPSDTLVGRTRELEGQLLTSRIVARHVIASLGFGSPETPRQEVSRRREL